MDTKINYTLVGAFVIVLTAAVTLAIIWLSSGFTFETYANYLIFMQESVSGLTMESPVEYNGVNVGNVKSVELEKDNPQLVKVLISIRSNTPITQGTVATLHTRGITGNTFIALKDRSTDLRPLLLSPGLPYPVIKTTPSLFLRLDTALNQLTKNFDKIANAIEGLLDKDNLRSLKATLANLQNITFTLSRDSIKMDKIISNTAIASRRFGPFMQSGINAMQLLQTQTLPKAYDLLSNLDNASQNLNELSFELKNNPAILLRGVNRKSLGPGEK